MDVVFLIGFIFFLFWMINDHFNEMERRDNEAFKRMIAAYKKEKDLIMEEWRRSNKP